MTDSPVEQRSYDHTFQQASRESAELTQKMLTAAPKIVREYTSHLALSRGKGIRAAALLVCSMDDAGMVCADAVRLAAAVEIIHLATLVHDDIIDDAKTRRGVVTLQKKYGRRTAVICGDYLLCAALQQLAGIGDPQSLFHREFTGDLTRVCLGELRQHVNHKNLSLSVYQYLKIISGKTAALFEASFMGGAMLLSAEPAHLRRYRRLGRYIGMIFQLMDDCIDYEETEQTAKKPVRSDFEQGVVTLPLIAAMAGAPSVRERLERGDLSGEALAREVRKSGGLRFTRALAEKYYVRAGRLIAEISAAQPKAGRLSEILDLAFFGPGRNQAVGV